MPPPLKLLELTEEDTRRFWAKVALPNEQGCMLWLRSQVTGGYGAFWLQGRTIGAHRVSYALAYGEIPPGLQVDHVKANGCTNRRCVAPDHLEAVTIAENIRRGDTGVHQRAKTHCPQGHPYAGENLVIRPRGWRACRTCLRASNRRSYEGKKVGQYGVQTQSAAA